MRCRFCGAEIKAGSNVCEYCGSAAEKPAPEEKKDGQRKSSVHSIAGVIAKVIVSLAAIWAVLIIVTLIVVLNSDSFKTAYEYKESSDAVYQKKTKGGSVNKLKRNATGLTGTVISSDGEGVASIECGEEYYYHVQILDKALIEWLEATDRSIDSVGIRFATDENGDIRELGLLSPDFFVLDKNGNRYTAVRDEQIIAFTSTETLEAGRYYGGYFSYPDMSLYYGEEKSPFAMAYMDLQCEDKGSAIEQEYYTGEEITTYRILTRGKWRYCSRDVYDAMQIGDSLEEYQVCDEGELAFVMKK